jgi:hypothetical protein
MTSQGVYSKYARFQAGGLTFCMDNGCLLIKAESNDYPYPLTAQATHQLFNLLFDYRQDIINANTAAKAYGTARSLRQYKHKNGK